jgi:hypothetical protein
MKKQLLLSNLVLFASSSLLAQFVGIGTSSPTEKLHVVGNVRITTLGGSGDGIVMTNDNGVLSSTTLSGNPSDVLNGAGTFVSAGSISDDWSRTGNAGTSPGSNYLGTSDARDLQVRTNGTLRYTVESTGEIRMNNASSTFLRSGANGGARILGEQGNTAARPAIGFFSVNGVDDGGGGNGIYRPLANTMAFATGSTERMRIEAGGDVGIGTTAPTGKLHVAGGRVEFTSNTDASSTSGSGVLEIANSLRIDGNEVITNTGSVLYLQNDNGGDLRVDGTTFAVDASLNRVGVGTTAPSTNLDINGTVRIRGGGPVVGALLRATSTNGTATWSNAGYGMVPIGSIVAWHKNAGSIPGLPAGWVECNGGTSNGITVPNLNGTTTSKSGDTGQRGRFLRGSTTSGLLQTDQSNNLRWVNHDDSGNGDTDDFLDDDGTTITIRNYSTSGDRFQAYLEGVETRVTNMSVVWIMRTQ